MNNLECPNILSEDILVAMDKIIDRNPDVIFGGSIVLNAVGLISRKISDIDVFVTNKKPQFKTVDKVTGNFGSETVDVGGEPIARFSGVVNDIKCCVFLVPDNMLEHSEYSFSGRTIKLQNVNYAIEAKINYAYKNKKHQEDLIDIYKTFSTF